MIAGITAFYVLIIFLIRDRADVEKLITLLIYNDPALIGFIFIGISIILEKDQQVLPALFVTPLNLHVYLIAKILTLSTIAYLGALAMAITAMGLSFNFVLFTIGAFSTCVLFCLVGLFVVSYTQEVLHFLLRAIPLLIFMSLPLLNYFELTDLAFLRIMPVQGGLDLMVNSYREQADLSEIVFAFLSVAFWTPVLYLAVFRVFNKKVVEI
jgi:fluoroquinolone transport system permease protein